MKKIILLVFLSLMLMGCNFNPLSSTPFSGLFGGDNNSDSDFVLDNDTVFDLFEDDFGTGTQYDDRFIEGGNGDVGVGDTDVSAGGEVDYGPEPSATQDPAYDKIGKMTPAELHALAAIEIPALVLGGSSFPFPDKQFGAMASPDLCDHLHYHGASGYTLDRKIVNEPSNSCGFDNAVKTITVTGDEMIEWFHNRPRNF